MIDGVKVKDLEGHPGRARAAHGDVALRRPRLPEVRPGLRDDGLSRASSRRGTTTRSRPTTSCASAAWPRSCCTTRARARPRRARPTSSSSAGSASACSSSRRASTTASPRVGTEPASIINIPTELYDYDEPGRVPPPVRRPRDRLRLGGEERMRLLVCGGAGFIGSATSSGAMLAKHADWRDRCVYDKLTYAGNLDNLHAGRRRPALHLRARLTSATADALAQRSTRAADVDAIVNFAAETHVDRSIAEPESFLRTDIFGTHTLLEAVRERGIARMVQVSTDEVYGSIDQGCFCETDRIAPVEPLLGEQGRRRPAGARVPHDLRHARA